MAIFAVNIDTLQQTIIAYQTAIEDIENAIKEAEQAIDVLKGSGWRTNASRAFFENFDSAWKTDINNRIKAVKHLKSCLESAKTDYDVLFNEVDQIGNSL